MNLSEYVNNKRPSAPSFVEGEPFLCAGVEFDTIVLNGESVQRTIFVDPQGKLASSLGRVVHKQAKFLEQYFADGGEPVEIYVTLAKGKRDYWVLTFNGHTIPTAE